MGGETRALGLFSVTVSSAFLPYALEDDITVIVV